MPDIENTPEENGGQEAIGLPDPLLAPNPFKAAQEAAAGPAAPSPSFGDYAADVAFALPRGVEESFHDAYGLIDAADNIGFDLLPEWGNERLLGTAKTRLGSVLTNVSQVVAGFYLGGQAIRGVLSLSKLGGAAAAFANPASVGALARVGINAAKGVASDVLFQDQEANLSNLLKDHDIGGPLTDFLSVDQDDGTVERRLKGALEGVGVGAMLDAAMASFKGIRRALRRNPDGTPETLHDIVAAETPAEVRAATDAARSGAQVAPALDPSQVDNILTVAGQDPAAVRNFIARGEGEDAPKIAEALLRFRQRAIANTSEVDVLRDNVKNMSPVDRARLLMEHGDFNMFAHEGPEGAIATARAFEQLSRDAVNAIKDANADDYAKLAETSGDIVKDWLNLAGNSERTWLMRQQAVARQDTDGLKAITARMIAHRSLMQRVSDDLFAKLGKAGDFRKLPLEQLKEVAEAVEQSGAYIAEVKGLIAETGRLLVSQKIPVGLAKVAGENPGLLNGLQRITGAEAAQNLDDWFRVRGGVERVATAVEMMHETLKKNGIAGLRHAEALRKPTGWDIGFEYFVNSLLSGPQTQVVNFANNLIVGLYRPLETALGGSVRGAFGALTGNAAMKSEGAVAVRDGLTNFSEFVTGFLDTFGLLRGARDGGAVRSAMASTWKSGSGSLLRNEAGSALNTGSKVEIPLGAITAENLSSVSFFGLQHLVHWLGGVVPDSVNRTVSRAVDSAGKVIRVPTRLLSTADEMFKQINARARARTLFAEQALESGLTGTKRAEFINAQMERAFQNGALFNERALLQEAYAAASKAVPVNAPDFAERQAEFVQNYIRDNRDERLLTITDAAATRAKEVTFTDESGAVVRNLKAIQQYAPLLRFAAPFVSTPVNLAKFAYRRSVEPIFGVFGNIKRAVTFDGGEAAQRSVTTFTRDITSNDPVAKADAIGRLVMAMGFTSTALLLAGNSMNPDASVAITGAGPKDPNERKLLEQTGWQQYSLRVNGKYYQYNRLDPFATIFGTIADLSTYAHFATESDQRKMEGGWAALVTAVANNLTNKTYLQGLGDFLEVARGQDPSKVGAVVRRFQASWVPNILNQSTPLLAGEAGDTIKEVSTFAEARLARTPWGADKLPPRRDAFGAPVKRIPSWGEDTFGRWVSLWQPMKANAPHDPDGVAGELARHGYPFSAPEAVQDIFGVRVDLRDFKNDSGQSADDRFGELTGIVKNARGQTYREALADMFKSPAYKDLPEFRGDDDLDNPKVKAIVGVQGLFRSAARAQLLKERPEIIKYVEQAQARAREGFRK